MTEHLTDERLNEITEHMAEVRQNGRPTILYTDEGILEKTYMSLSTDVVEQLITTLQRERAAHQATQEKIKQLRNTLVAVNAISMHRPSCPHCAKNNRIAFEAISTRDIAHARQGEKES